MELFDGIYETTEKRLIEKANYYKFPIGGSFELLPLCNMNCKMCYVHLSREEMQREGNLLSADEWIKIAEMAKKEGTLFIQFTGGEPLLYPDFKKLYTNLCSMGFVLTMNTNATLIDEEWVRFFASRPPRQLNITLYGASNQTYERLCGNSVGFTQVMNAVHLLIQYKINFRFNYTITPYNKNDASKIHDIAQKLDIPIALNTYIFPPIRCHGNEFIRNTPEETANILIDNNIKKYRISEGERAAQAKLALQELDQEPRNHSTGYRCSAGTRGFWVNWKGELQACAMFNHPCYSLKKYSFHDAWRNIVSSTDNILKSFCAECESCKKRNLCQTCLAACLTETGSFSGKPEYLCKVTDEKIKRLLHYTDENTQKKYQKYLID